MFKEGADKMAASFFCFRIFFVFLAPADLLAKQKSDFSRLGALKKETLPVLFKAVNVQNDFGTICEMSKK